MPLISSPPGLFCLRGKVRQNMTFPSRSQSLFLRWILCAGFAVTCFVVGWACRGNGQEKRGGDIFGGGATTSVSGKTSFFPTFSPLSSHSSLARYRKPTDTLVVYIFANSGERIHFFYRGEQKCHNWRAVHSFYFRSIRASLLRADSLLARTKKHKM